MSSDRKEMTLSKEEINDLNNNVVSEYIALRRDLHCKYCNKKFSNSQALGGHQNAHKRERALEKKEKMEVITLANGASNFCPPSSALSSCYIHHAHAHAPPARPLGVRSRSAAIYKPFNSRSCYGGAVGWWSAFSNLNRQISTAGRQPPNVAVNPQPTLVSQIFRTRQQQYPPSIEGYWFFEHQPPSDQIGAGFNYGGRTAFLHPFAGTSYRMGTSASPADDGNDIKADHHSGGIVSEDEKEKGEPPEIDLTLAL